MRKACQPVVGLGGLRQLQHVLGPLQIRLAQLGDRSIHPQVRRRVDDMRQTGHQPGVVVLAQAQASLPHIAGQDLHPVPDGAGQFGPVPPGARQAMGGARRVLGPDEGADGVVCAREQARGRPERPGNPWRR